MIPSLAIDVEADYNASVVMLCIGELKLALDCGCAISLARSLLEKVEMVSASPEDIDLWDGVDGAEPN